MKTPSAKDGHNASGTPLSHNGYVICQVCGREVQGISRETAPQYAYCSQCRLPLTTPQEVHMPSAPKPSQVAKDTKENAVPVRSHHKKKPTTVAAKVAAIAKATRANGASHIPPKKGKCGVWLAEIKAQGGITKQAIVDGCTKHGLKSTMHNAMVSYCRQLSLLKD